VDSSEPTSSQTLNAPFVRRLKIFDKIKAEKRLTRRVVGKHPTRRQVCCVPGTFERSRKWSRKFKEVHLASYPLPNPLPLWMPSEKFLPDLSTATNASD